MNIKLLAIGKTDNKNLQSLIEDYQKRLSFYIKLDLEILPDIKNVKNQYMSIYLCCYKVVTE